MDTSTCPDCGAHCWRKRRDERCNKCGDKHDIVEEQFYRDAMATPRLRRKIKQLQAKLRWAKAKINQLQEAISIAKPHIPIKIMAEMIKVLQKEGE